MAKKVSAAKYEEYKSLLKNEMGGIEKVISSTLLNYYFSNLLKKRIVC